MDTALDNIPDDTENLLENNEDGSINGTTIRSDSSDTIELASKEIFEESEDVPEKATSCKRLQTILDSESDDDDMPSNRMKSGKNKLSKVRIDSDSDSNDDSNQIINTKSNKISNLIDSESDEDVPIRREVGEHFQKTSADNEDEHSEGERIEKPVRKKNMSKRAAKDEAMNKIHSETQRLIRESSVYLPYHRPKQRSLGEFLERKRVAPSLPKALSITNKLKMSATIVDQVLEEKEEEAIIFYASSDSEEEANDEPKNDGPSIVEPQIQEEADIEDTQKLQQVVIPQRQQIIHDGSLEFGIPRKLFIDEDCTPITEEQIPDEENNLRNVSMPRKLFDENFQQNDDDEQQHTNEETNSDITQVSVIKDNSKDGEISDIPIVSMKEIVKINEKNVPSNNDDKQIEKIDALRKANNAATSNSKKCFLSNLSKLPKPKLHGSAGTMIDLTETFKPNKVAINSLMDRFLTKHAPANKQDAKDTELTILNTEITPDGLKITKDVIPYKVKSETVEDSELNKPGAKFTKFKEEMEKTMASKRKEEWEQKEKNDDDSIEDWEECEIEEFEKTDKSAAVEDEEEEEESDDEPEENDIVLKDVERKNHAFCDDEAEVSENDCMDLSEDEEENNEEESDDETVYSDKAEDMQNESKTFNRIIKIDDESNDSGDECGRQPLEISFENTTTNKEEQDQSNVNNSPEELSQISLVSQMSSADPNFSISQSQMIQESDPSFPNTQNFTKPDLKGLISSSSSQVITDSQLMNLCSGTFSTPPPPPPPAIAEMDRTTSECKQTNDNINVESTFEKNMDTVSEEFSLKISSSSDDENCSENTADIRNKKLSKTRKKKKVQQLSLSEDEDDMCEQQQFDDDYDDDADEEEEEEVIESEDEHFIDYDSEENEVVVVPKKDIKKVAANFLEEEAELSESDWGSADEDEKDMDKYEVEEGDTEEIDEGLVRDQIGKIHTRQLLDEDNRDVRMLKEMLFDDGDLHDDNSGRERKFRWKNINSIDLENASDPTDIEQAGIDEHDEENHDATSEVEWRKLRLERQRFLEERAKPENADEINDDDDDDDQLFQLGIKALGKKNNEKNFRHSAEALLIKRRSLVPRSVSDLVQTSSSKSCRIRRKGSFLARGEQVLAKLAIMTKQADTIALKPANTANFVFAHLSSPAVESTSGPDDTDGDDDNDNHGNTPRNNKQFDKKRKLTTSTNSKPTKKAKV